MPDDNLFPNQPVNDPPGNPPANGNGADPAAAQAPLTLEAGAELVTQALTPLMERLEEQGQVIRRLAEAPPPAPVEPKELTGPAVDFLTQFSEDPEGAVAAKAHEPVKQLLPLISNLMASATGAFVSMEAAEIDQEFGPGAWKKHFEKPMTSIIDNYRAQNPAALSDRSTITKEVNGLKGVVFNELVDYREESRKKAAETSANRDKQLTEGVLEQVTQRTNLTGGLRRAEGSGEEVTEAVKGYLADRARAIGTKAEDPKEWLQRTDYGNSLEDYLAHQKKQEGK